MSDQFRIKGNTVTSNLHVEIAKAFNEFFTTIYIIGPILANKVPTSTSNPLFYVKNVSNSIVKRCLRARGI